MKPDVIFVRVSTFFLPELSEWSKPLQVKAERQLDGTYELIFREPEEQEANL
jgi:hypothetical protein